MLLQFFDDAAAEPVGAGRTGHDSGLDHRVPIIGMSDDFRREHSRGDRLRIVIDCSDLTGPCNVVKGATPAERVEHRVAAISKLNGGRKKALVKAVLE